MNRWNAVVPPAASSVIGVVAVELRFGRVGLGLKYPPAVVLNVRRMRAKGPCSAAWGVEVLSSGCSEDMVQA